MRRSLILVAPCLAFLANCGGSSTGNTSIEQLWQSPTGSSAGLVRATNGTRNSLAIVSDVNNAGRYRSFTVTEVISETRNSDGSFSGEVTVRYEDGTAGNVLGRFYEDTAALYASVNSRGTSFVVGGEQASNLPVGSYSYEGYAESVYTYSGSEYNEVGTFSMDVQFGAATAQLTADTAESRYTNDNLIVSNGELSGTGGTFVVYASDGTTELERRTVDFNGTFHGSGATHVSGVAVGGATSTDDLSVMGIVGKR